jgi:hypothetical protein
VESNSIDVVHHVFSGEIVDFRSKLRQRISELFRLFLECVIKECLPLLAIEWERWGDRFVVDEFRVVVTDDVRDVRFVT